MVDGESRIQELLRQLKDLPALPDFSAVISNGLDLSQSLGALVDGGGVGRDGCEPRQPGCAVHGPRRDTRGGPDL